MTLSPKAIKFSHVGGRNWKKDLYGFLLKSHDKSSDINVSDDVLIQHYKESKSSTKFNLMLFHAVR